MNQSDELTLIIPPDLAGRRLDQALTSLLPGVLAEKCADNRPVTRSQIEKWIEQGRVSINGQRATRAARKVSGAEVVALQLPRAESPHLEADPRVAFDVIYEDRSVLVLNKPPGLVVHPGAGNRSGTLVHGLLPILGENLIGAASNRPGLVHRLDKGTSGLMVVAKTDAAYHALVEQFRPPRKIHRDYLALVLALPRGANGKTAGTIDLPIARHRTERKRMHVSKERGRVAETSWQLEESLRHGFLLRLSLATGRTHQIRVHLNAVGAAIVGDPVYGAPLATVSKDLRPAVKNFGRQALHATALSFIHPANNDRLQFSVPPPADMLSLIHSFRDG